MDTDEPGRQRPDRKSKPNPGSSLMPTRSETVHFVKNVAITVVVFKVGVAMVRFIGRRLKAGNRQNAAPAAPPKPPIVHASFPSEDSWTVIDAAAPIRPEGYKEIASAVVPCSVQNFYQHVISGPSNFFSEQHQTVGKQYNYVQRGWERVGPVATASTSGPDDSSLLGPKSVFEYVVGQPGSGGYSRLLTFVNPKKPPSSVDTRCVQRQQFCVYRGDTLIFATAMNMLDIPFKENFTVNTFWEVKPGAEPNTCSVTILLKVQFLKRTLVSSIINATTFRDTSAFYQAFMANAKAHLESSPALPSQARDAATVTFRPVEGSSSPGPSGSLNPANLSSTMPVWKQLRAFLVFSILLIGILHQVYLAYELAAVRAGESWADTTHTVFRRLLHAMFNRD